MNRPAETPPPDADVQARSARLTRRAFAFGAFASAAGLAAWRWLGASAEEDGLSWPLRRVLQFNETLAQATYRAARLSPTFPLGHAAAPDLMRINGRIGLDAAVDAASWRLQIGAPAGPALSFSLDDLRALPRTEMVTELKCIEGWSQVIFWAGVRLADFLTHYRLGTRSGAAPDPVARSADLYPYVALETPDGGYYVGLDIDSALHPQTLLCYEMGGRPLTPEHGAPLRLAVPLKYGVKNLKRIGRIRFSDRRPRDYWAERGYDWYAGL
jgi:hypothetical protein